MRSESDSAKQVHAPGIEGTRSSLILAASIGYGECGRACSIDFGPTRHGRNSRGAEGAVGPQSANVLGTGGHGPFGILGR